MRESRQKTGLKKCKIWRPEWPAIRLLISKPQPWSIKTSDVSFLTRLSTEKRLKLQQHLSVKGTESKLSFSRQVLKTQPRFSHFQETLNSPNLHDLIMRHNLQEAVYCADPAQKWHFAASQRVIGSRFRSVTKRAETEQHTQPVHKDYLMFFLPKRITIKNFCHPLDPELSWAEQTNFTFWFIVSLILPSLTPSLFHHKFVPRVTPEESPWCHWYEKDPSCQEYECARWVLEPNAPVFWHLSKK